MDPSLICRSNLQRAHVGPSAKENVSIKCEQMLKAEVEGTKLPAFEDSPVGFPRQSVGITSPRVSLPAVS